MPVYPIEAIRPLRTGHYPHMAKHDAAIWERFLAQFAAHIATVAYDVALGGYQLEEGLGDPEARRGWRYSTALKVDALAITDTEVWICEVRPTAGVSALGAALCYTALARQDGFTEKKLIPVVITDYASADIRFCAEELGVVLYALPPPDGQA